MGRLINDDYKHPNANMKVIEFQGKPHLCLFAVDDLDPGSEVRYNYGKNIPYPWRVSVKYIIKHFWINDIN